MTSVGQKLYLINIYSLAQVNVLKCLLNSLPFVLKSNKIAKRTRDASSQADSAHARPRIMGLSEVVGFEDEISIASFPNVVLAYLTLSLATSFRTEEKISNTISYTAYVNCKS